MDEDRYDELAPVDMGSTDGVFLRLIGAFLLVVVLIIVGRYFYQYATNALTLLAKGHGVHVCSGVHFAATSGICLSDDQNFSAAALSSDFLTAAALADSKTIGLQLTVQVSQRADDGSFSLVGRAPLAVLPVSYRSVTAISAIFAGAGVVPTSGATYQFEVNQHTATQIDGSLGTVIFSLTS
jgi:hypothetical protein